jgi:potassium channel subfamily K
MKEGLGIERKMNVDTPLLRSVETSSGSDEEAKEGRLPLAPLKSRDNFFYLSILYVVIYLTVGSFAYLWIFPLKNNLGTKADFVDTLYFCLVTLTTVGYGDYHPREDAGKAFTIFYLMFGVGFIGYSLSYFIGKILEKQERVVADVIVTPSRASSSRANTGGRKEGFWRCDCFTNRSDSKVWIACARLFLLLAVGTIVFDIYDDRDFIESAYFVVVSATTVGYGDVSPESAVTKIFAIIWLAVTTLAFGNTISALIDHRLSQQMESFRKKLLSSKISKDAFSEYDLDNDGEISKYDWLVYHLVKGRYPVYENDIAAIMKAFFERDKNHSGSLERIDLGL